MKITLLIIQILLSVTLTGIILIQAQGTGLGRAFGGGGVSFSKRGLEGLIFKLTFIITALFLIASILDVAL